MSVFAVIRERGPAWNTALPMRQQERWDEHAAFMDALAAEGFIVMGGPLGDGTRVLHIVEAESEEVVRRRFDDDPWPTEMLRIASIEPWEILLRG